MAFCLFIFLFLHPLCIFVKEDLLNTATNRKDKLKNRKLIFYDSLSINTWWDITISTSGTNIILVWVYGWMFVGMYACADDDVLPTRYVCYQMVASTISHLYPLVVVVVVVVVFLYYFV